MFVQCNISDGVLVWGFKNFSCIVEPCLSDSCLSVPSIIWNDVQKFLKQTVEHMIHCLLFNKGYRSSSKKETEEQTYLIASRQGLQLKQITKLT